jgi:flagellar hook-basal body complex protein FliE
MSTPPLQAVSAVAAPDAVGLKPLATAAHAPATSFGQMLMNGVEGVQHKLDAADKLAARFAVDDSIPVHQVTYALEQARMSLELLLQVRSQIVGAYQELSRMQL